MKSESKSLLFLLLVALFTGLLTESGYGGTVNINFTRVTVTGSAEDGPGILGDGEWNRRNRAQATVADILLNSNGAPSGVTVTNNNTPPGASPANSNIVQRESWSRSVEIPLNLTIKGLRPNGFYRLACYSDLVGDGVSPQNEFSANGIKGSTTNATPFDHELPGTAGTDYVLLLVPASSLGQINLNTPVIAGLQIQGVFAGETGPKMDCMVTDSRFSPIGTGRGIFGIGRNPAQTLTLSGRLGVKRNFHVNTKNIGPEYDKAFLMAFPDRGLRLKITDETTRQNVTAAAIARRYRYDLNAGQTKGFTVEASAVSRNFPASLKVGIGASPSTLRPSQQDVVNCVITP